MKVLITENKLFDAMYNYIDETFDLSDLTTLHPDVWDDNEMEDVENPYITNFYDGEYSDNPIFSYFSDEYYGDEPTSQSWKQKSPMLEVNGYDWQNLTSMFGSHWIEPMKKWFEDKFNLPIKTVTVE
jgi:hypothetical protein